MSWCCFCGTPDSRATDAPAFYHGEYRCICEHCVRTANAAIVRQYYAEPQLVQEDGHDAA